MSNDRRDALEVLQSELNFIEKGGYGRSVETPWQPTSIFQDSLSCINFANPQREHPCSECLLLDFVPPEERAASVPCHSIPLNERAETIAAIDRNGKQEQLEEAVEG